MKCPGVFCEDTDRDKPCVRRIFGSIGFMVCLIYLFMPWGDKDSMDILMIGSLTLLGTTTFDKFLLKH